MNQALVTIENNIPLADSRQIAEKLGISHRSFFSLITEYQEEVEKDFGSLRFQIAVKKGKRGGAQPRYAMLTEDQTYVYLAYSKNTEKARTCKRMLVKAFAEARQLLASTPRPLINSLWEQRLELFHQHTKIPHGYWSIFGMVAAYCRADEFRNVHLVENALPDGSVGRHWCEYLRTLGYDPSTFKKYPHWYPDKRGVRPANIYSNDLLGVFWTWFHGTYLETNYPLYLKGRLASDEPRQINPPE